MNRRLAVLHKHSQYEALWWLMRSLQRSVRIHHDWSTTHQILPHIIHQRHSFPVVGAIKNSLNRQNATIRQFSSSTEVATQSQPPPVSTTTETSNASATDTRQPNNYGQSNNYGYRDLLKWTDNILHPNRTPIGSINSSLWLDTFIAMQVLLGYNPSMTVEQLLETIRTSDDPNNAVMFVTTEPLIPRHVDLVDRLLSRLLYEQNAYRYNGTIRTHRRNQFLERNQQLQLWTTIVCQSWLTISKHYPNAPMAIQKASMWYNTMNETVWSTPLPQNDVDGFLRHQQQKVPFVVALIQAYQRLVDAPGLYTIRSQACQSAANLLLDESTIELMIPSCTHTPYADMLTSCYQLALQQTLEFVAAENTTMGDRNMATQTTASISSARNVDLVSIASQLLEQITRLSELPEWSDIRFQDGELDKVFDALFLDRMRDDVGQPDKVKKKLSPFERGAMQQRIVTKINQSKEPKDQEAVEEMVMYWRIHMQDDEEGKDSLLWKPFAQAVTNFYLRVQDPVKATKWMQIQEQMPSQEVVLRAIQSTAARPSIALSDEGSTEHDASTGSTFEELIALDRVFAENEHERIKQKLNLLEIWATKIVRSPSVPWRATEILESIESETNSSKILTPAVYAKVVKLWIHRGADMIALQKAFDIAMRCPVFDMSLLISITNLLVMRQTAGDTVEPPTVLNIVDMIREKFVEIPTDQMEVLVSNAFHLLRAMPQSQEFLKFILDQRIDVTSGILNAAVQSYQPNVALLLPALDRDKESVLKPNDGFCKAAIQHLLSKPPLTPQVVERVAAMLRDLTVNMCMDDNAIDDVLDLHVNLLEHIAVQQYEAFAKRILLNVENAVFAMNVPAVATLNESDFIEKKNPFKVEQDQETAPVVSPEDLVYSKSEEAKKKKPPVQPKVSPIPMSFYKRIIILFGEKSNARMVEYVYSRLQEHRANGYYELLPDQSCCAAYLKVTREAYGWDSLDNRIDTIQDLTGRYIRSNMEDENFKPEYLWFDILIGDLYERMKSIKVTPLTDTKVDPYERFSRAAVNLIDKMHSIRITPRNNDRVFPFNVTMEMVLACRNKMVMYKVVNKLKAQMDDLGLVANSYTLNFVLQSCEHAESSQHFAALTTMLQCLAELKQMGKTHSAIYSQCFKIFQSKRKLTEEESVVAEKMMVTVFQCCIDDGMLINPVRRHFKSLSLPATYEKNYLALLKDGHEPSSWTRNVEPKST